MRATICAILLLTCTAASHPRSLRGLADADSVVDSSDVAPTPASTAATDDDATATAAAPGANAGATDNDVTAAASDTGAGPAVETATAAAANDSDEIISIGIIGDEVEEQNIGYTIPRKIAELQALLDITNSPIGLLPQIKQLETKMFGLNHTPPDPAWEPRIDAIAAALGHQWCVACSGLTAELEALETNAYGDVRQGQFLERLDALEVAIHGQTCADDAACADPNDVSARVDNLALLMGVDLSDLDGNGDTGSGGGGGGDDSTAADPFPDKWCQVGSRACLATVNACAQHGSCGCGVRWNGQGPNSWCSLTNDSGYCQMRWANKPAANVCSSAGPEVPLVTPVSPGPQPTPVPVFCGIVERLSGQC